MAAASAELGRPLMPHQRLIVDVFLEVQSEAAGDPEPGEWAFDDGLATLQRRGGKTAIQSPLVTHRARLIRRAQMFMTAQNRNKARRRWMDITDDLLASPLRHDVRRKVSISHEELRWIDGGACLMPFAPNEDEMHSETPHLVLIDELWAFDAEQARLVQAGYVPAFATSSGQALKLSTQGTERSAWLNAETRAGRLAVERDVRLGKFFAEWSLPDRVGGVLLKDLDDELLIDAAIDYHPAVCHRPGCPGPRQAKPCPHGFTVRPAAIRSAFLAMADRAEFIRAYGNRAANDLTGSWLALDESTWLRQIDTAGIPENARLSLGVWVDEDAQDAAISAGFRDVQGRMHVEIPQTPVVRGDGGVEDRPTVRADVRWVLEEISKLARRSEIGAVAVANVGPARDIADALETAGVTVLKVSQADLAAACSRHKSELEAGTWWHRVSTEATSAAKAADWNRSRWSRPGESISALGAQTLAGWGFDHAPEPEETHGRFAIG